MSRDRPYCELSTDLLAVGDGDREALHRVYLASSGKLFSLCLRITGSQAGAEDVLQETFIKVWNRAPAFDPARASGMAWIGAIARNSAIDWYRAHHRREFIGEDAISFIADEAEAIEDRMIREEQERRAVTLLSDLPEELAVEIRSAFFEGLTYAQLAKRKNIPLGTLKSRIRRGLLSLRRKFDNE